MNKAQLVATIASKTGLTKKDVSNVLETFVDTVVSTVSKNDTVTLTGFGTFKSVHRSASVKRNPRTGDPVNVPARNVPKFTPGKAFKESVK
jgi:DNA-binding protein HU-beta